MEREQVRLELQRQREEFQTMSDTGRKRAAEVMFLAP